MDIQGLHRGRAAGRPPLESALGKPLLTEPKSLTIINQDFQRLASAAGKHKQRALQRLSLELLPTEGRQPIDALAQSDRFDRQQNPHLRSDLNHGRPLQNASVQASTRASLW